MCSAGSACGTPQLLPRAFGLVEEMKVREVPAGEQIAHALLAACCGAGDVDKAMEVLEKFKAERVVMTVVRRRAMLVVVPVSAEQMRVLLHNTMSMLQHRVSASLAGLHQDTLNTVLEVCVRVDRPATAKVLKPRCQSTPCLFPVLHRV